MPKLKPFRAVIYNQDKIADLSRVTCPPYDVISETEQRYYHDLSPYNFIHILLGMDIPGENKYIRAKKYLDSWLKENILASERSPAFYFYSQQYDLNGENFLRLGFIGLLRLESKGCGVYRHEHTRQRPKEDRLRLLNETKASLSPVFVLFKDRKRLIQQVYQKYVYGKRPLFNITDLHGVVHRVWKLSHPELLEKISSQMKGEDLFIADGHHRWEVACVYKDMMASKCGQITGEEDFNYVLAYFTDTQSKGLKILPTHRLVRLDPGFDFDAFLTGLKDFFQVSEISDYARLSLLMKKASSIEHVLGLYKDGKFFLLRLKDAKILDKAIAGKSRAYRSLDVCVLNYIILEKLIGSSGDSEKIHYSQDVKGLIAAVDSDKALIAFFLNPVKVEQMVKVAMEGERMPPKSTYFYPKVLSGLVINKHAELPESPRHQDTETPAEAKT